MARYRRGRIAVGAGLAFGIVALAACGANAYPDLVVTTTPTSNPAVTTVQVTPDTLLLTNVGETGQLTATALDSLGDPVSDVTFAWSSADESVATVAFDGTVTGTGTGETTITASAGNVQGSVPIVVSTP